MSKASTHVSPTARARGQERPLFDGPIVKRAIVESFKKLDPRHQARNPVMFVVLVGSAFTTCLWVQSLVGRRRGASRGSSSRSALWLWFTVLFANFAEAMAEGRGKAQADTLRKARKDIQAKKLASPKRDAAVTPSLASELRKGDLVLVEAGDSIPMDGEWSRASRRSTRAPSPAKARRSSARAAEIAAP